MRIYTPPRLTTPRFGFQKAPSVSPASTEDMDIDRLTSDERRMLLACYKQMDGGWISSEVLLRRMRKSRNDSLQTILQEEQPAVLQSLADKGVYLEQKYNKSGTHIVRLLPKARTEIHRRLRLARAKRVDPFVIF